MRPKIDILVFLKDEQPCWDKMAHGGEEFGLD
jgi:hypothetical protein